MLSFYVYGSGNSVKSATPLDVTLINVAFIWLKLLAAVQLSVIKEN